jgi:hypothetical protein
MLPAHPRDRQPEGPIERYHDGVTSADVVVVEILSSKESQQFRGQVFGALCRASAPSCSAPWASPVRKEVLEPPVLGRGRLLYRRAP